MTEQPRSQEAALREALERLRDSIEGRCGNPRCPSEHVDYAPDCTEYALSEVERVAEQPRSQEAAPRSVDQLLETLEVGPDPVYWAGYRDGKAAAEQPRSQEAALDVERLATAIHVVSNHAAPDNRGDRFPHPHPLSLSTIEQARTIAAEYDRLAALAATPPEDEA